jgi:hypothetical protein
MTEPRSLQASGVRVMPQWNAVVVALVLTAVNLAKPLSVDDPAYYDIAHYILQHPLDPYGGVLSWWGGGTSPQSNVTSPPLFMYWLAAGMALFGESELACKLWMLPFALMLTWAVERLGRRFAPGLEGPLTWIVALSPPVLVDFNLLLDVPVVACGLAAVAVLIDAVDRGRIGRAVVAGLLAAAACSIKYTALVPIPGAMLWYALLGGRPLIAIAALVVAALGFAASEVPVVLARGHSQLFAVSERFGGPGTMIRVRSIRPALTLIGEATPVLLPMALAVIEGARRWVVPVMVALVAIYALIALDLRMLTLPGAAGAAIWVAIATAVWRAWRALPDADPMRRDLLFLVPWLAGEMVLAIQTPPFPAVRRFIEPFAVAVLLLGAIAARTQAGRPDIRALYRRLVAFALATGFLFEGIDLVDAWNVVHAAEIGGRRARELAGGAATWFTGVLGFTYYAPRAGLQLVQPGQILHAGDVVVVQDIPDPPLAVPPASARLLEVVRGGMMLPLRTTLPFYTGQRAIDYSTPAERGAVVRFYRIDADMPMWRPTTE